MGHDWMEAPWDMTGVEFTDLYVRVIVDDWRASPWAWMHQDNLKSLVSVTNQKKHLLKKNACNSCVISLVRNKDFMKLCIHILICSVEQPASA